MQKHIAELVALHNAPKPRLQGELPSQTEKNPKEQVLAVTTRGGKTSGAEVNNETDDVIILDAGIQEEKEAEKETTKEVEPET